MTRAEGLFNASSETTTENLLDVTSFINYWFFLLQIY